MFIETMLVLIFLVLLWIAIGLQVVAMAIKSLGKLIKFPVPKNLIQLERHAIPFVVKMATVKVLTVLAIHWIKKKF